MRFSKSVTHDSGARLRHDDRGASVVPPADGDCFAAGQVIAPDAGGEVVGWSSYSEAQRFPVEGFFTAPGTVVFWAPGYLPHIQCLSCGAYTITLDPFPYPPPHPAEQLGPRETASAGWVVRADEVGVGLVLGVVLMQINRRKRPVRKPAIK